MGNSAESGPVNGHGAIEKESQYDMNTIGRQLLYSTQFALANSSQFFTGDMISGNTREETIGDYEVQFSGRRGNVKGGICEIKFTKTDKNIVLCFMNNHQLQVNISDETVASFQFTDPLIDWGDYNKPGALGKIGTATLEVLRKLIYGVFKSAGWREEEVEEENAEIHASPNYPLYESEPLTKKLAELSKLLNEWVIECKEKEAQRDRGG